MGKIDLTRAMQLAVKLDRIRSTIQGRWDDFARHEDGVADLLNVVRGADPAGIVREDWQGGVIRACGIRATSTSGITGAVGNWIRQVEAKSGMPLRHPATNIGE